MRVYETTFIVNPQTDDATIDQQVSAVTDLITRHGGTILAEDRMGTRRLAYPIKKLTQGYYHTLVFEAPQATLPELDRYFRLNEAYLRYLTILFEGNSEELRRKHTEEEPRRETAPEAKKTEETAEETATEAEPEEVVVAQSVPTETAEAAEESSEEESETEAEAEEESEPAVESESEEEETKEL
jgi:small subunit ribosomal protein S6